MNKLDFLPLLRRFVFLGLMGSALFVLSSTSNAYAQAFSSIYDLRSAGPDGDALVPEIQDQSNVGDCWAFATTTALDSNLIKNGYLPTSTTPPPMALSQWHLTAYNGTAQYTQATIQGNDINYNGITGGFTWMTTAYYNRGQGSWPIPDANPNPPPATQNNIVTMGGGPVLQSSNPLNAFPLADAQVGNNLAPDLPPVNQPVAYTLTGAYYFDPGNSGRTVTQQVDVVKQAIETYGAVATLMYAGGYTENNHDESVFQYDTGAGYEYEYNPSTKQPDHVVTIIGWNDNITLPGQTTPGAWIVQNSWGTWGGTLSKDDGTFYAPYTDPYIGEKGVTAFTAVPAGKYSPYVLQNELGPTAATGNSGYVGGPDTPTGMGVVDSSKGTVALSKLTVNSPSTLLALGLTSLDAQPGASKPVTVTIYNGFSVVDGIGTPGVLLETQTFVFPQTGYTVFDLDTPLTLYSGEILAVEVDYEGSAIPYVWESSLDGGVDAPTGLTYFYDLTTDEWQDLALYTGSDWDNQYPGVFSVKGLLAVPEPSDYGAFVFLAMAGALGWRRLSRRTTTI